MEICLAKLLRMFPFRPDVLGDQLAETGYLSVSFNDFQLNIDCAHSVVCLQGFGTV